MRRENESILESARLAETQVEEEKIDTSGKGLHSFFDNGNDNELNEEKFDQMINKWVTKEGMLNADLNSTYE